MYFYAKFYMHFWIYNSVLKLYGIIYTYYDLVMDTIVMTNWTNIII